MQKFLLIILFFLLSFLANSQEYNYTHYTIKDGLAGNTVYGVAQDKDGYLFFATENGVSRFDGKEWVTFTVKDGLPDNEVLVIFCDSRGRVWMSQFNKTICYYYQGKIHNAENDTLIKKIRLKSCILRMHENEDRNIIFSTSDQVFKVDNANAFSTIISISSPEKQKNTSVFLAEKNLVDSGSIIFKNNSLFSYKSNQLHLLNGKEADLYAGLNPCNEFFLKLFKENHFNTWYKSAVNINSIDFLSRFRYFVNTNNGSWSIASQKQEIVQHFLKGIKIGHTLEDFEGDFWFTTLGNGVYKNASRAIKTSVAPIVKGNTNREIYSITQGKDFIIGGATYGKLLNAFSRANKICDFQNHIKYSENSKELNRATSSLQFSQETIIIGFDSYLLKLQNEKPSFNYKVQPVKSIEKIDNNYIICATSRHTLKIRINDLKIIDTIWNERTTYANYLNHQYYIGTLTGLYIIGENKQQIYLGHIHPALKRRITCIKNTNDSKVFIATADAGIIVLKNNKVIGAINEDNGLTSNIIKTIHINNNFVWVGTIKGINKIDIATNKVIAKYSISDGLPSDIINAIYVDDADSTIWVGSPEGLTHFNEKEIGGNSICNLVMQKIIVSNTALKIDSNNYAFDYKDNNIQFQFVGISFRSGDEIVYHHRLLGLNDEWKTTKGRLLDFPSLPYNKKYTLQLYATNKFGVHSKTINFSFYVSTPFYLTTWFNIFVLLLVVTIVYIFFKRRFDKAKKIQAEKSLVKQQLADMEQLALQAQMNPHFIFNCLNSIQQFIMVDDKLKANQYLTDFATLIRSTLDNSSKKNISVAQESLYLKRYLDLEQLRFGDTFSYEINIDESVDKNFTQLPAMLLQPFVENSLRHGVRLKKNGKGMIKINFIESENYLICSVIDNGVGREAAAKVKSHQHIEYQSKGVELTTKRIGLLNTESSQNATIEIIDLKDDNGIGVGTEVIVRIPT